MVSALGKMDPDSVWLVLARLVRPASAANDARLPPPDAAYEQRVRPLLAALDEADTLWSR